MHVGVGVVWLNVHVAASAEHSQFWDAVGGTTRCMEEEHSVEGASEVRDRQRDIDIFAWWRQNTCKCTCFVYPGMSIESTWGTKNS